MAQGSEARADDGKAYAALVAIAVFDVVSLPVDLYMGIKGERVPEGYAMAETILGGLQVAAGGVGTILCAADAKCKREAWMPLLVGFTAWTSLMTLHGAIVLGTAPRTSTPLNGPKPANTTSAHFTTHAPMTTTPAFAPIASAPVGPVASGPIEAGGLRFSIAPMIGDARTTPIGVGLVGSF